MKFYGQRDCRIYEPFLNIDIHAPSTLSLSEPTFTVTATVINISPALFQAFTLQNVTATMSGWTEGESYLFYDSEGKVPPHEVSRSSDAKERRGFQSLTNELHP